MSALPVTLARRAPERVSAIVVGDPDPVRVAAGVLVAAGLNGGTRRDASSVLVLAVSGDATARLVQATALRDEERDARIVVVMPCETSARFVRRALRAGIDGIVREDHVADALAATVIAVAAGQIVAPSGARAGIAPPALSHREKEVLALVARGFTNRQIADALFLAESTVKTHLASAFRKIDAGSRAEAAALVLDPDTARDLGLLAAGEPAIA